ncbi:hypothetical protein ACLKA7_012509 [Drosophila subpalustris]
MFANIRVLIILVIITSHQSCFGYYIRNSEESLAIKSVGSMKNRNEEREAFRRSLSIELNKSQNVQLSTKELLNRLIKETPKKKTNTNTKAVNRPGHQVNRLLQALFNNLKNSNQVRSLKPLKRSRRKIADTMLLDTSSEQLIKMFHDKHNDDGDYGAAEMSRRNKMDADSDSDYEYDNLYDDERDVALTAKSNRNLEYGSFQDLILQAKRNQWEQDEEETKLQNTLNDHFF